MTGMTMYCVQLASARHVTLFCVGLQKMTGMTMYCVQLASARHVTLFCVGLLKMTGMTMYCVQLASARHVTLFCVGLQNMARMMYEGKLALMPSIDNPNGSPFLTPRPKLQVSWGPCKLCLNEGIQIIFLNEIICISYFWITHAFVYETKAVSVYKPVCSH